VEQIAMGKFKLSPIAFGASILCFFLPFVTVSCGGRNFMQMSGVQLATGTTMQQPGSLGNSEGKKFDPDPFAALAGLCAVVGLGLAFLTGKGQLGSAITGTVGTLSLLILKFRLDNQVAQQGGGMILVSYEFGFYLTFLMLAVASGWSFYLFISSQQKPQPAPPASVSPST
jgi:hypothetical protein